MIDTHAHLDSFAEPEPVLERAWQAGVHAVVAVAMNEDSVLQALDLAAKDGRVWPALGLHPWAVAGDTWQGQVEFASRNLGRAVAVGECGLDYKKRSPRNCSARPWPPSWSWPPHTGCPPWCIAAFPSTGCWKC